MKYFCALVFIIFPVHLIAQSGVCFFDAGQLIILMNGFQKKSDKTPKNEIELATKLKKQYFNEKERE